MAALNIEAQTINSLFRLPFGFLDPEVISNETLDARSNKLLKSIDAVVIDEISMVRADMVDAIDIRLRKARGDQAPFGGVQIIMFGDPYQLPPVIADKQLEEFFAEELGGPYFFNARVWRAADMDIFELVENFRQKDDEEFRTILNAIRQDEAGEDILQRLNERVEVRSMEREGVITLATRNNRVDELNRAELAKLAGSPQSYQAAVEGDLEERAYPADASLHLKEGAQVMFLKNDKLKRWVNGTIGVVESLAEDQIRVNVNGTIFTVPKEKWHKVRYRYDAKERKVLADVMSTFTQFPLRLAWAITVHKSQGKTYSQALVDMGSGAFAHGQAYVALSRCTSLDGLYLERPLTRDDIIVDPLVVEFMKKAQVRAL